MAWRVPGICPDAVLYIRLGKAFEAGQFEQALGTIRFNIYPLLLAALHRTGLEWEMAGVIWGVVISSLTVLPLYGWVRRMLDERIALGACFLYAVHPGLIRSSFEIIRDSTFWFLFAASVYLLWRATSDFRRRWFPAAAATITLACLVRFEGLALYVLLAVWGWQRARSGEQGGGSQSRERRRIVAGILLCISVYPASLLAINGVWYHGRTAGLVRTYPAELASAWAQESLTGKREAKMLARPDVLPALPSWKMAERYSTGFVKALSPPYLLALVWGLVAAWPSVRRREILALAFVAAPIFLGIWVHLFWSHEASPRYFLPIVILTTPAASLGLWSMLRTLERAWRPISPNHWFARLTVRGPAVGALMTLLAVQLAIAFNGDSRGRAAAMQLGGWIGEHYGPATRILGPDGTTQVAAYYAQGQCESFPDTTAAAGVMEKIGWWQPTVVLLATDGPASWRDEVSRRMATLGFGPITCESLPPACERMQVMARSANAAARDTMRQLTYDDGSNPLR